MTNQADPNKTAPKADIRCYTVTAYRGGDRSNHSYIVGVFSEKDTALGIANEEEDYRYGKYECEVREWIIDDPLFACLQQDPNRDPVVKPLKKDAAIRAKMQKE